MTPKQAALEAISRLPDDVTVGDILYAIHGLLKMEQGPHDAEADNTLSHEDITHAIDKWLTATCRATQNSD